MFSFVCFALKSIWPTNFQSQPKEKSLNKAGLFSLQFVSTIAACGSNLLKYWLNYSSLKTNFQKWEKMTWHLIHFYLMSTFLWCYFPFFFNFSISFFFHYSYHLLIHQMLDSDWVLNSITTENHQWNMNILFFQTETSSTTTMKENWKTGNKSKQSLNLTCVSRKNWKKMKKLL